MTTLREAAQQALETLEALSAAENIIWVQKRAEIEVEHLRAALKQHDKDVQWLKEQQEQWSRQKSLWERAMHSQCLQGCEFLAMEQRRNEREERLKERGVADAVLRAIRAVEAKLKEKNA
jgi:hypothetical protein